MLKQTLHCLTVTNMFILKKDILRPKGFYFIIFILIFLSISLFCSGLCLVYYSTLGVSSFLSKSNLSDIIIAKQGNEQENTDICNWAKLNSDITQLNIIPTLDVTDSIFISVRAKKTPIS